MDKITQDNAALAQQSAAASEELKAQAEQVRLAVGELMRMARGDDGSDHHSSANKAGPSGERVVTPRLNRTGKHQTLTTASSSASHSAKTSNASHGANGSNGHSMFAGGSSNGTNGANGSNDHDTEEQPDMTLTRGSSDDLSFEDHR